MGRRPLIPSDELRRRLEAGRSYKQIAAETGIKEDTLSRRCRKQRGKVYLSYNKTRGLVNAMLQAEGLKTAFYAEVQSRKTAQPGKPYLDIWHELAAEWELLKEDGTVNFSPQDIRSVKDITGVPRKRRKAEVETSGRPPSSDDDGDSEWPESSNFEEDFRWAYDNVGNKVKPGDAPSGAAYWMWSFAQESRTAFMDRAIRVFTGGKGQDPEEKLIRDDGREQFRLLDQFKEWSKCSHCGGQL